MHERMDLIYDRFLHAKNNQPEQHSCEEPVRSGGRVEGGEHLWAMMEKMNLLSTK